MRVLNHVCCAPCFTAVGEELAPSSSLTAYFFNPNIHPRSEWRRRLAYVRWFSDRLSIPLIAPDYDLKDYFRAIGRQLEKPDRCLNCYRLRLGRTAEEAAAGGYHAFTTTLLISPYQYHDELKNVGLEMAERFGVEFLYRDFRGSYRRSVQLSKALEMYRQKYCGCVFSEGDGDKR